MAADQERADRIRALKHDRPDLTWRRIAEYVGVTERSAAEWQRKGGIDHANAKKLAELFEVDADYIWRGPVNGERAPSPFAGQDALTDRLDRIENRQQEILDNQRAILDLLLGYDIEIVNTHDDESATRLAEGVARAQRVLRDANERQTRAAPKPAARRSRVASA